MASLLPLLTGVLPSIVGPIFGRIFGKKKGDGMHRMIDSKGMGLIGGRRAMGLIGGRRRRIGGGLIGGRRRYANGRRGRGFKDTLKKIGKKILFFGQKAHALYNNKNVRGLVKHGINTYKLLKSQGVGRKRPMKIKFRPRGRGGLIGGAIDAPPGPLA